VALLDEEEESLAKLTASKIERASAHVRRLEILLVSIVSAVVIALVICMLVLGETPECHL